MLSGLERDQDRENLESGFYGNETVRIVRMRNIKREEYVMLTKGKYHLYRDTQNLTNVAQLYFGPMN